MVQVKNISSPEEIRRRKILRKGIDFTILICGEEGTGKNAFINTLCNQEVIQSDIDKVSPLNAHKSPGINIVRTHVNIVEENSTPISLDIVLTPGFASNINNEECISKVVSYLERQFDDVLEQECRIKRDPKFKDGRPHAALYFIRPTSKGLRELDIAAMKHLAARVNVIPVISKADTLTVDEIQLNKTLITRDIEANGIEIYDFLTDYDDVESSEENNFLKENLPFAVAGSRYNEYSEGNYIHIREYPWGIFNVDDLDHSDFTLLKNVLFGSHLQELKDTTHSVLYENYRARRLSEEFPKGTKNQGDSIIERYTSSVSDENLSTIDENPSIRDPALKRPHSMH